MPEPALPSPPPSRDDWREIFSLLDECLELDPAARPAWLASLGAGHARLLPKLGDLLREQPVMDADGFLQSTPVFAVLDDAKPAPPPLAQQSLVGPYRLLREIGQGGMANVWLAERADGLLERRVALKLPHVSWGSALAERMARERSILASLTHPNIARLYDVGTADDGRPFLAMEYIDGQPIDAYAAARGLGVRERVDLVLQVARAVAHAHAQLVVHRDLKPSNILVDAQGRAHLLDFGIAKLIDPDVAGADPQATVMLGRALTPDYASPEQIRGDALGTASDVYSLGVVAYELLAGAKPYSLPRGDAAGLEAALLKIDVVPASAKATDARARAALKGDLDAVLSKAMRKEPPQRYATVNEFATDLQRHLTGQGVLARNDAWFYVWQRRLWRHRLPLGVGATIVVSFGLALGPGATALVVAVSLAGVGISLWQAERARQRGQRALREAAKANAVKDFLLEVFDVGRNAIGGRLAGEVTLLEAMNRARSRVGAQLQHHPGVRREVLESMASVYQTLDRPEENFELLQAALEAQRDDLDASAEQRVSLLSKLIVGAFFHARFENIQRWIDELDTAVAEAGDAGSVHAAELLYFRGRWLGAQGRPMPEVLPWLERAEAMFAERHPLAACRLYLQSLMVRYLMAEDRSDDALRTADANVLVTERLASIGMDHGDAGERPNALSVRGLLKLQMGQAASARSDLRQADTLYRSFAGEAHFLTLQNQAMLGRAMVEGGDVDAGLDLVRRAEAAVARVRHGEVTHCKMLEHLGLAWLAAGQAAEAVTALSAAREAWLARSDVNPVHAASTVIALSAAHLRCAALPAADEALAWVESLDRSEALPNKRLRRMMAEQRAMLWPLQADLAAPRRASTA